MASTQNAAEKDNVSEYEDAVSSLDKLLKSGENEGLAKDAPEHRERESLGSKTSYLLTLVGYAVGFGNLWRFPYRLQTHGGVFLIPYVISVLLLGLPVLYLELSIGQRLRKGPVGAWNEVSSYLGGIGITSGCICFFLAFYYNTLVAYCISYLVDSFHATLPWDSCETALSTRRVALNPAECYNASNPSKYYWFRGVLDVSEEIETLCAFRYEMYLCLLLAWFFCGVILIKGLEFTGKIVYFTACFPYFVLFIFLIFGWTLPGMGNGYHQMFSFEFENLLVGRIWIDAASQIFFSLGVGYGTLISYSSTLPAKNNVWIDAMVVTAVNCATSILSCCVVFDILGFRGTENYEACHKLVALAYTQNLPNMETCLNISDYISESGVGTGLAFIAFAKAIKKMHAPQLFNFLFFLMLLTLGIDSSFGTVEGLIASLLDLFPKLKRWTVAAFCVWLLTLFYIVFAFGWGNHVLTVLDSYSIDYSLLIISFMERIAVGWFYGLGNSSDCCSTGPKKDKESKSSGNPPKALINEDKAERITRKRNYVTLRTLDANGEIRSWGRHCRILLEAPKTLIEYITCLASVFVGWGPIVGSVPYVRHALVAFDIDGREDGFVRIFDFPPTKCVLYTVDEYETLRSAPGTSVLNRFVSFLSIPQLMTQFEQIEDEFLLNEYDITHKNCWSFCKTFRSRISYAGNITDLWKDLDTELKEFSSNNPGLMRLANAHAINGFMRSSITSGVGSSIATNGSGSSSS